MQTNNNPRNVPYLTLDNGSKFPSIGYGTWNIDGKDAAKVVYQAIKMGYRCIDCAACYGNEKEVGQGIKQAIDEGIIKREDLFVTSKLWNTDHGRDHVKPAFDRTLSDLGLEYLDLFLIHFPISLKHVPHAERYPSGWFHTEGDKELTEDLTPIQVTWEEMEKIQQAGLSKSIGLSNMMTNAITDVWSYAKVKPSVLQVELHPFLAQNELLKYCQRRGIAVTGYTTLGGPSFEPEGLAPQGSWAIEHPSVLEVAKETGKSPAQVCLKWAVKRGYQIIPKSLKESRMEENIDMFSWDMTEEQMEKVNKMDKGHRFNNIGYTFGYQIYD